jgi:hypothetical protein
MNPLQNYNFVPTTVTGNQFISYRQSADYMTNYQNSSDLYSYFVNNASKSGVVTGHQLRQYLQDNGVVLASGLLNNTANKFINMETQGSPNTCTGAEQGVIYSGGKPLIDAQGDMQMFPAQCGTPGQSCMMVWDDTPLPQQGPHCQVPPKNYYSPYSLLN